MGKTYRNVPISDKKQGRKPKRNRARKGEVRPNALPPNKYDELNIAGREEYWFYSHPDIEEYDPEFKKKIKRLKQQGRKMRRKDIFQDGEIDG